MMQGGCNCGAVRYRIDGEAGFSFLCHCRRCQRATGSGHAPGMKVERDQIAITGRLAAWSTTAETGAAVTHEFCGTCGSPLFSSTDRFPTSLSVYAASLDDPSLFAPQAAIFTGARQPWDHVDPALDV
ncbi:MAG: GFA family protein [Pseudomonadota bacterium]